MNRRVLAGMLLLCACTDPQKSSWGLDAILTMPTPVDDPKLGCGVQMPVDTRAANRQACEFRAGATPSATLGLEPGFGAKLPIRHIILMMKENRSFDQLLGNLHFQGQSGVEAVPSTFVNVDNHGEAVPTFRATTTCLTPDPGHQSDAMLTGVNHGKMDGFVRSAANSTGTDGHFAMATYTQADLPFYYFLARTFAINDRHFAPVLSGTYANRNFFLFGFNAGAVDTGIVFPAPNTPHLLQQLMSAGATWGSYTDSFPLSGSVDWNAKDPGVHPLAELFTALDKGTLPNLVLVDGTDSIDDDHPVADLQKGEAWSKKIYDHAIASPQWERTAIIWVYDEAGGFADHVPPEPGCRATPTSPFTDRGTRVPLVVISPWAKRNFVSYVPQDHTAITRFIATVFDLPALTARDANSSALLEMFDFSCGRNLTGPQAPDGGTGGCAAPP